MSAVAVPLFYFIFGVGLLIYAVMKSCVMRHNFIDRGNRIACSKCGLTYVKSLRNKK